MYIKPEETGSLHYRSWAVLSGVIPKRRIPNGRIGKISQQDKLNKTSSHNFRVRLRIRVKVKVRVIIIGYDYIIFK